ncbi:glycosyltransferase [Hymenobacter sp. H14-R3]|nr:glycosyltransferase [Hymenobacter sp. H14-R3]MDJ0364558.1 glycosyltransferase [Hymenobacter sp. H14-R3]
MITYNHASFLAQAIEGVMMQQVTFAVHLIIADDKSTDSTLSIAQDYAERFPNRITVLTRPHNLGMMPNFIDALNYCNGSYIALCEGDDYWDDPKKLQMQVDFLESNHDYSISFHNLRMVSADGQKSLGLIQKSDQSETTTIIDLAKGNFISTLSCVFRNTVAGPEKTTQLPDWYSQVPIGDYCLHMLNAKHGKIKYFPAVMGAYRMHGDGAWSLQNQITRSQKLFDTLEKLKHEFDGEVRQLLNEQQLHNLSVIADEAKRQPTFDFDAYLLLKRPAIERLISDQFVPFMNTYYGNEGASRSAEYRLSKRLFQPVRWLVNSMFHKYS